MMVVFLNLFNSVRVCWGGLANLVNHVELWSPSHVARQGNVKFLVQKIEASPDQTRPGIFWVLSGLDWDFLVSIWFVLGITGSPCSRRRPDIGPLSQTFPDLAPLGPVWLKPGFRCRTLGPSETAWYPTSQNILVTWITFVALAIAGNVLGLDDYHCHPLVHRTRGQFSINLDVYLSIYYTLLYWKISIHECKTNSSKCWKTQGSNWDLPCWST